jgi:MFS family permease
VFPVIAWANVAGKHAILTDLERKSLTQTAPVIAPIAGGWIVENTRLGWHWTEWVTLIISGAAFIIALLFLPETYLPLLLDWKAKHLRRVTGDERYVSEHGEEASFIKQMRKVLPLPAKFWAKEPVISVLGSYLVLLYTLLFTFLSGFDYIFKQTYGFSTGQTGSCFGAIAAGATAFACLAPGFYSWARYKTEHAQGSLIEPEFRLWPAIVTAPLLPIALFWLGWGDDPKISYWSSLGACFVFGIVLIAIYVSSYEYIVDSYGDHSAIGLASITMVRYLIAGGMVMAARPMFEGIGVHWTMTLLGCIAAILTPAPLIFWKLGPTLRKKSPYAKSPGEH